MCENKVASILKKAFSRVEILKIFPQSSINQGYLSEITKVLVRIDNDTKSLLVKCSKSFKAAPMPSLFLREIYFYENIMPAFKKFQSERLASDDEAFDCTPKYYKSLYADGEYTLIVENLQEKGFIVKDYRQLFDDAHMRLLLKTLAKLHAVSFAMQDQDMNLYEALSKDLNNLITLKTFPEYFKVFPLLLNHCLRSISKEVESDVWHSIKKLQDNIMDFFVRMTLEYESDANVITHGDCWSNNILFNYTADNEAPMDIRLIDFQIVRNVTPVLDVVYSFYMSTGSQLLRNFKCYQQYYYDCLSKQTKALGTDLHKFYTYSAFESDWKLYAKYGYLVGILTVTDLGSIIDENGKISAAFIDATVTKSEIIQHIRDLTYHFYENDLF